MVDLGQLKYVITADIAQFHNKMGLTRQELAALKKVFVETRQPIERMNMDMQGLMRLLKGGDQTIDTVARGIAKMSTKLEGGAQAALLYAHRMEEAARAIRQTGVGEAALADRYETTAVQIRKLIAAEEQRSRQLQGQQVQQELLASMERGRQMRAKDEAERMAREERLREKARLRAKKEENDQLIALEQRLQAVLKKRQVQQALANAQTAESKRLAKEQADALKGWRNQVAGLAKQIGVITAAYGAWRLAIGSTTKALELQREALGFEIFTGSAEKSGQLVENLRDFAARTPVVLTSATQASTTMLQFGVSVDDVMTRLGQLGDVSGGAHERLQRLALAFGQITANTRLQGQELRQLIESGFNPLAVISEKTGVSMAELRDRMAEGEISAELVGAALDVATGAGGRFEGRLKRVAEETPFGAITVMRGELEKLSVDLSQMATPALAEYAQELTNVARGLREVAGLSDIDITENINLQDVARQSAFDSLRPSNTMKGGMFVKGVFKVRDLLQDFADSVEAAGENRFSLDQTTNSIQKLLHAQKLEREEKEAAAKAKKDAEEAAMAAEEKFQNHRREQMNAMNEAIQLQNDRARRAREIAFRNDPMLRLRSELSDVNKLEGLGFLSANLAGMERERLTQDFIDSKVKELKENTIEAAKVAEAGSREEFQIISQIARDRQGKEAHDRRMHEESQKVRKMIHGEIRDLPKSLLELFPESVGSP